MHEFPWNVLEIAPTSDQRAIKKAYAKKLKRCRPDDNPEGFQELHMAYTNAQYLANELAQEDVQHNQDTSDSPHEPPATPTIKIGDDGSMSLSASTTVVDESSNEAEAAVVEELTSNNSAPAVRIDVDESDEVTDTNAVVDDIVAQQQAYEEEQAAFRTYTEELIELLKGTRTDPDYELWDRYLNAQFMQDFDYRRHAGYCLFDTLISLCVHYYEREDGDQRVRFDPKVSPKLLAGLDNFFKWTEHRIELENTFDLNGVDYLLYLVEEYRQGNNAAAKPAPTATSNQQHQKPTPPHRQDLDLSFADQSRMLLARSIAFVIDVIIVFAAMAILTDLPWIKEYISVIKHHDMLISLVIASLYIPLMESLNGATVGQQYQGLQVLHAKTGEKLSFVHSLARLYIFLLSSFTFKITLWANLFFCRHPYVHDLASRSRVEPAND